MKRFAMFAVGVLFGTTGIKIVGSKDTKKAYGRFFSRILFLIAAVTVRSAGGQGIRPHKACRAAGLVHGIVRMTQSRRQVVRSQFLHQCADTAPGKPPFIAAAARVFVKVHIPGAGVVVSGPQRGGGFYARDVLLRELPLAAFAAEPPHGSGHHALGVKVRQPFHISNMKKLKNLSESTTVI